MDLIVFNVEAGNASTRRTVDILPPKIKSIVDNITLVAFSTGNMSELAELIEPHYENNPLNLSVGELHDIYEFALAVALHRNDIYGNTKNERKLEALIPHTLAWGYKNLYLPKTLSTLLTQISSPLDANLLLVVGNSTLIAPYNPGGLSYETGMENDNLTTPLGEWFSTYLAEPFDIKRWKKVTRLIIQESWFEEQVDGWNTLSLGVPDEAIAYLFSLFKRKHKEYKDAPLEWVSELIQVPLPKQSQ